MVNGSNVAVPSSLPDYRIVTEERSTEYMYNGSEIDDVNLRGASIWVGSVSANATNEYIDLPSGVDLCFRIYKSDRASIFVLSKDAPDILSINLDNVSDYQFISGNVD